MGLVGGQELILLLTIALPIIALVDILKHNFKPSDNKIVWALIVLLLPLIGTILYFIIGRKQRVARR